MFIETTQAQRQHLLDNLISQLAEFVVVVADVEGRFLSWHPGVKHLFGYDASEFLGMSLAMLLPEPDRLAGDAERELASAAATGKASDTRWLVTKDGQQRLVDGVALALRDERGNLVGLGKVLRDVTEQGETEERLRALTRALEQSTVFMRELDGKISHWTTGCERLYGWTATEAAGKVSWDLLQTVFPEPIESIQAQLLREGF